MEKNYKQSWEFKTIGKYANRYYTIEMEKNIFWFITLISQNEDDLEIETKFSLKKDALRWARQLEKEIKLKDLKETQHLNKNGNLNGFVFKGEFIEID